MILAFVLKRSFGNDRYYPVNEAARAIVDLTGRKCLKDTEVQRLRHAGFVLLIEPLNKAQTEEGV